MVQNSKVRLTMFSKFPQSCNLTRHLAHERCLVGPVAEPRVPPVSVRRVDRDAHAELRVVVVVRPRLAVVTTEVVRQREGRGVVTETGNMHY